MFNEVLVKLNYHFIEEVSEHCALIQLMGQPLCLGRNSGCDSQHFSLEQARSPG